MSFYFLFFGWEYFAHFFNTQKTKTNKDNKISTRLLVNSLSHPPTWFYCLLVVSAKIKASTPTYGHNLGPKLGRFGLGQFSGGPGQVLSPKQNPPQLFSFFLRENPPQLSLTSQSHKI